CARRAYGYEFAYW
nr:immunoglobulin heavy chain junction region [Mus musculus]